MHPNELDLLDYATGESFPGHEQVKDHVATCGQCSAVVAHLAETAPMLNQDDEPPHYERAPSMTVALAGAVPDPAIGTLWRVDWDGIVQFIAIVSSTDSTITAMPVVEAEMADGTSVMIGPTTLGWNAALLASELFKLPLRVLDRYLGRVTPDTVQRATPDAASDSGHDPVVSHLDERWAHRVQVHEQLAALSNATWLPNNLETSQLLEELRAKWSRPQLLAADLGVNPGQASAILTGQRPLTVNERQTIGRHLGREIGPTGPPEELLWALDHPQTRPSWRDRAARAATKDRPLFRWETYTSNNFALAARATGGLSARERQLALVKHVLDAGP